ncbi:MAG: hypothetical protein AAF414_22735 [Pseudomonadota bacterium]
MRFRIAIIALVTVWVCSGTTPARASIAFIGTFGDWDVRTEDQAVGQICAARALHPELGLGDIFWAFNTASSASDPSGYLALDPRFLPNGGTASITIDGEVSFDLSQAADGYIYASPANDLEIFSLMRSGLDMLVEVSPNGEAVWNLEVSLLGFTRATDAARVACGLD